MKKIFTNPVGVVLIAVLCNILWGSAYPAIKSGYELFGISGGAFNQILFAGIRFTIAGIMVLLLSFLIGKKVPVLNKNNAGIILMMACIYTALQYIFFYLGLSKTSGTNGSIVNSTSTFMAVILAHFLYKDDRLNLRKIIGTVLGFSGVLLVTLSGGNAGFSLKGEGFIMIAAFCFVIGSIMSKRAVKSTPPMTATGYNLFIGGIILIIIGLSGGGRLSVITTGGIMVLMYLSFLSAAAFTLWTMLLEYNPVGKISVYNFIIPVSGTILSAVFLHENIFEWKYIFALILVCTGIITVNKKK